MKHTDDLPYVVYRYESRDRRYVLEASISVQELNDQFEKMAWTTKLVNGEARMRCAINVDLLLKEKPRC